MVRTLWTAASGMIGQQINVDTIANNLANVNTTGYSYAAYCSEMSLISEKIVNEN